MKIKQENQSFKKTLVIEIKFQINQKLITLKDVSDIFLGMLKSTRKVNLTDIENCC